VKAAHLPAEPKESSDLHDLPEQFKVLAPKSKKERWMLSMNDPDESERIIIFATGNHLKLLHRAKYWTMDGTFKSAAHLIGRIYAISIFVKRASGSPSLLIS